MSAIDPKNQDAAKDAARALTKAEVAKLVKRTVLVPAEKEDGKATEKEVAIKESEVLDFKDYGDRVVVVTTDGQKFTGNK